MPHHVISSAAQPSFGSREAMRPVWHCGSRVSVAYQGNHQPGGWRGCKWGGRVGDSWTYGVVMVESFQLPATESGRKAPFWAKDSREAE